MDPQGTFEEELARLAGDLRALRLDRGAPTYRRVQARAADCLTGIRLPAATQSDAFRGKRLLGFDLLMGLVRVLLAYDSYGRERPVPPHNSAALQPWRDRWRAVAALRPPRGAGPAARSKAAPAKAGDSDPLPVLAPVPAAVPPPVAALTARPTPIPVTTATPPPAAAPVRSAHESGFALAHLLTADNGHVWGLTFSPDGRSLAATDQPGNVRLWDLVNGRPAGARHTGKAHAHCLAFSPDGRILAVGHGDHSVHLWDAATLDPLGPPLRGHTGTVSALVFSPDGRTLVSGAAVDGTMLRWDVSTGEPTGPPLTGHRGRILALGHLRDGRLLAAMCGNSLVELWDPVAGTTVGEAALSHGGEVVAAAFSADGRLLATAGEGAHARLWDTVTGRPVGPALAWAAGLVWDVAFSPDGRLLAAADNGGTVQLWDTGTGTPVGRPLSGDAGRLQNVVFSPDGRSLAASGEGDTVVVHSLDRPLRPAPLPPLAARALGGLLYGGTAVPLPALAGGTGESLGRLAFSPDGNRIFAVGGSRRLTVWDPVAGRNLPDDTLACPPGNRWGLTFSPVGGQAAIWTRMADPWTPLRDRLSLIKELAFAPDGRFVAVVEADGRMRLWNGAGDRPTGEGFAGTEEVTGVICVPDGSLLVLAVGDGVVRWDPATGLQRGLVMQRHEAPVRALACSPDSRLLASGDAAGTVLLSGTDGRYHPGPDGHPGEINDLAFSPDGTVLAIAGSDGLRLWNPLTREPVAVLLGHGCPAHGVAFSPDGGLLAATGPDGTVRLWLSPRSPRDTGRGPAP
ncbi:WD40 repeat domain-containing protein [Streptomyces sp. NPDC088762]|uniref:WD40 repeat domain-containing protein n=1 Tax=Streptomyces sp. NPDC088762 TaxID=3365891 RepID=UPI0038036801